MPNENTNQTVYLWSVNTDELTVDYGWRRLNAALSPDERTRASRFRFDIDRDRFVAGRFFLRRVLGVHTGANAKEISFQVGQRGKPVLKTPLKTTSGHFSFSRSGPLAACAFTNARRIGVDLEFKRPIVDLNGVAGSIYSMSDFQIWKELDEKSRLEMFYRSWTRKEAVGKIDGSGISDGPDNINVPLHTFAKGEAYRTKEVETIQAVLSDWNVAERFHASVAFEISDTGGTPVRYLHEPIDLLKDETVFDPENVGAVKMFQLSLRRFTFFK